MIVPGMVMVVLCVIAFVVYAGAYYASDEVVIVTVEEKWTKYHSGDAKYLFSNEEGVVYSIEDSLLLWQFDASDRYALIKAGGTYEITTYGWRIHILSWYKNAMHIEEVKE